MLKAPLALQLVGARTSRVVEEVRKMHTPELFALFLNDANFILIGGGGGYEDRRGGGNYG